MNDESLAETESCGTPNAYLSTGSRLSDDDEKIYGDGNSMMEVRLWSQRHSVSYPLAVLTYWFNQAWVHIPMQWRLLCIKTCILLNSR